MITSRVGSLKLYLIICCEATLKNTLETTLVIILKLFRLHSKQVKKNKHIYYASRCFIFLNLLKKNSENN